MRHEKIEKNIYFDKRCGQYPYYVNMMRDGQTFYKKFETLEQARKAKEEFEKRMRSEPTDHPLVFKKNERYIIETAFFKEFDDYEEATRKADIIQKFMDN